MLLTILVPVYNGARHLEFLLGHFENYRDIDRVWTNVEIVVVNNKSTDDTLKVVRSHAGKLPLRMVDAEHHVPTAEENVFRSFKECKGEYVWTLGVDDAPVCASLDYVIDLLEKQVFDFMVFNNPCTSDLGAVVTMSPLNLTQDWYEADITEIAQRIGLWFVLAGMSGHILRRKYVEHYDFKGLVEKTSAIYSHVIAYLECFAGKRSAIVNMPLVYYRLTYHDKHHWINAATKLDVCDEYFWTVGFVRQLRYLEEKGVIKDSFVAGLIDHNDHLSYKPSHVCILKLYHQIREMASGTDVRNNLSTRDFYTVYDYLISRDHTLRDTLWILRELYELAAKGLDISGLQKKAEKIIKAKLRDFLLSSQLHRTLGDYEIYKIASRYLAVSAKCRDVLSSRLRYIGNESLEPFLYASNSFAEIEEKIRNAPKLLPELPKQVSYAETSQIGLLRKQCDVLERRLKVFETSKSWRVTAPMRACANAIRALRGKTKNEGPAGGAAVDPVDAALKGSH